MRRINYIAAFYFGDRMNTLYSSAVQKDKFYIFQTHLEAVKKYHSGIDLVTFVFNLDNVEQAESIKQTIENYQIPFEYELVFRPNRGASYGAWAQVIEHNINDFEYFFITEDDYIPDRIDFFEPFIERCRDKYAYICMFCEDVPPPGMIDHASIPMGVISGQACRTVLKNQGRLFQVFDEANTYDLFYKTQERYCEFFVNEGFRVGNITDAYCSPFMVSPTRSIRIFGNESNPVLVKPIPLPEA